MAHPISPELSGDFLFLVVSKSLLDNIIGVRHCCQDGFTASPENESPPAAGVEVIVYNVKTMSSHESGSYALLLYLSQETSIGIGRLGLLAFSAGYYVYVGSAMRCLHARIRRHLRTDKKMRWHIDYLRRQAVPVEVWIMPSPDRLECRWARSVAAMSGALDSTRGFGSSDCSCRTHLLYFESRPSAEQLREVAPTDGPILTSPTGSEEWRF